MYFVILTNHFSYPDGAVTSLNGGSLRNITVELYCATMKESFPPDTVVICVISDESVTGSVLVVSTANG
jgi:hypothetical protein